MNAKTSEEARNQQVIRSVYALAEGNAKDTSKFVLQFADDGYFYDLAAEVLVQHVGACGIAFAWETQLLGSKAKAA